MFTLLFILLNKYLYYNLHMFIVHTDFVNELVLYVKSQRAVT